MNTDFRYYLHDGPDALSFELSGFLSERAACELEQIWRSASSNLAQRSLIVDLSYVSDVHPAAQTVLRRWHELGAQLVAKFPDAKLLVSSITGEAPEQVAASPRRQTWRPIQAANPFPFGGS